MKGLMFGLLAGVTGMISAATLNVDFDVRRGAVERDPVYQRHHIAIFVLDRSGSMKGDAIVGEGSRNRQLAESVRERVKVIAETEPDTEVYYIPFSTDIGKMFGPKRAKDDLGDLVKWKGFDDNCCSGVTLLYDTLAYALDFAEECIQKDPKAKVQVYGYTDGGNYTPSSTVKNENIEDTDWFGNKHAAKVKVCYPTKKEWNANETEEAYRLFASKYIKKIEQYVVAGKMNDIQWRWLGAGKPPKGIDNIVKDEYQLSLLSDAPALKNPIAVAEQDLPVTVVVPLPERYAKDLDGLSSSVTLEANGKKVSGKVLSLKPGKRTVSFQISDSCPAGKFSGRLSLSDLPDTWETIALKPPAPLELSFAAPDALSFLSVSPVQEEIYIRAGDKVDFSAKASDDATVTWKIGGKVVGTGAVSQTFERAGDYAISAHAERSGFASATTKIAVHVIEVGVEVAVKTAKPTIGEKVDFVATARGKADGFSWWIDGVAVQGHGNALSGQVFDKSGKHAVKARAVYGHGLSADSAEVPFSVAVKPSVVITEPYDGGEFEFGKEIACNANVEGDFDKVIWKLSGPASEEREAPVVKEGHVSKPAIFKPGKGGNYTISATASGPAGTLAAKTVVKIKVARENLGVAIVSPASGASVELGSGVKNAELRATVKGDAIKEVKWTAQNRKTGKAFDIRTTPVQGGVATCAFPNDPKLGDDTVITVQAEAVLPTGEDPVVSAPIDLVTKLIAEIDVEAKVDGKEANGREVRFGEQVDLLAVCKGEIDAAGVQWFAEVGGKERAIGTGPKCTSPKEKPDGENLRTVRYFAKAKLADGTFKASRKVTVIFACPDFESAKIKLYGYTKKGEINPVERHEFGLRQKIHGVAEVAGGEVKDVVWEFGDGRKFAGAIVDFPGYGKYGTNTVKVTGKCAKCGKTYYFNSEQTIVREVEPKAVLKYTDKDSYTRSGNLHIDGSESEGDIASWTWKLDGREIPDTKDKASIDLNLPDGACDIVVELTVAGLNGAKPSTACTKPLRVRYGWWAAVPAVLVLLLLLFVLLRLCMGNSPRKWSFHSWPGGTPKQINGGYPDELGDAYLTKGFELVGIRKWNYWSKKGRIRLGELLGVDDADGDVWQPFSADEFEVWSANGTPIVKAPDGKFDDVTGEVNTLGEAPYFLFRYIGLDYADDIANGHDHIRVRVVENGGGTLGLLAFLVAFGLLIWGFVVVCLRYAI